MFTGKRAFIAWAALAVALAAVSVSAGEDDDHRVRQTRYKTSRSRLVASQPRRVTVWRDGTPTLTSAQMEAEEDDMPPMPPDAPNGQPWRGGPTDEGSSPFLDETYDGEGSYGCADGSCGGECGGYCTTCAGRGRCAPPWWAHRSFIYGQYLLLNATDVDMAYAIQQNGTGGAGTTPEGRVGVIDQNYTSAYATGFGWAMSPCASIQVNYVAFRSHNTDSLSAPQISGGTVASLVFHPESTNEGSTSSLVDASNDINFQTADVEYRRLFRGGCRFALNYSVGARYAKLDQSFWQLGNFSPPTGTIQTTTNVNFEGGGLKVGLDGMRRLGNTRFGLYGKGFLSLMFGTFNSDYLQYNTTTQSVQASSNWTDERVVPILDYEVGVNFTSHNGHWRWSTGYYTAFWFNAVATPQWVQAVQNANFVNLGETIAFNGLVTRLEFRF